MSHHTIRSRYGSSKTRTGCITCKARHVKCDEAKPHCRRCLKGARKCEGYAANKPRTSHEFRMINYFAPNLKSVSLYPELDSRELRALEYIQLCTTPQLAGPFSADLWSKHMLRLAKHQPSVHHALVAFASFHEEFANPYTEKFNLSEYATQEYGKAIHGVIRLEPPGSPDSVEAALTTCIIFSCLENLRGHHQSSLSHLMSGLNVLEEDQRQQRPADQSCIPKELLLSLFLRMDSQRMDLGGSGTMPGRMPSLFVTPSIPDYFLSLHDAWPQLEMIYHRMLQLMYLTEEAALIQDTPPSPEYWNDLMAQIDVVKGLRQAWEKAYCSMLGRDVTHKPKSSYAENRTPGVIVLDIANTAIWLMLEVDLLDPEPDFDNFEHVFQTLVNDAEEYINKTSQNMPPPPPFQSASSTSSLHSPTGHLSQPTTTTTSTPSPCLPTPIPILPKPDPISPPIFTLSLGCVNVLYLSAARCRNSSIRHRALNLLRKCNRREGFWDSNIAARIAEGVIAIEEARTLQSLTDLNLHSTSDDPPHLQPGFQESPGARVSPSPSPSPGVRDRVTRFLQVSQVTVPPEHRVKTVDIKFGPETGGRARYSMEYTYEKDQKTGLPRSGVVREGLAELFEW